MMPDRDDGLTAVELAAATDGTVRIRRSSSLARDLVGGAGLADGGVAVIPVNIRSARLCACGRSLGYRRKVCDDCKRAKERARYRSRRALISMTAEQHEAAKAKASRIRAERSLKRKIGSGLKLCPRKGCTKLFVAIGRRVMCPNCVASARRERERARRATHRDEVRARAKKYAAANREKLRAQARARWQRRGHEILAKARKQRAAERGVAICNDCCVAPVRGPRSSRCSACAAAANREAKRAHKQKKKKA